MLNWANSNEYFIELDKFKKTFNLPNKIKCKCWLNLNFMFENNYIKIKCNHCNIYMLFAIVLSGNYYEIKCLDMEYNDEYNNSNEDFNEISSGTIIILSLISSIRNGKFLYPIQINMHMFTQIISSMKHELKYNNITRNEKNMFYGMNLRNLDIQMNYKNILCEPIIHKYLYIITWLIQSNISIDIIKLIISDFELVSNNQYKLISLIDYVSTKNFIVINNSFVCRNSECTKYSKEVIKYNWKLNNTGELIIKTPDICKKCSHNLSTYDKRLDYQYWRKHSKLCIKNVYVTKYACDDCKKRGLNNGIYDIYHDNYVNHNIYYNNNTSIDDDDW